MPSEHASPDKILSEEYTIHKEWDDARAEECYSLYRTVTVQSTHGVRSGNREWAERQAAHYGIAIQDAE